MGRVEDVKVHLVARSWGWFVEQEEKFNRTCATKRPTRDNHASMRARGAHSLTTEVRSVSQPSRTSTGTPSTPSTPDAGFHGSEELVGNKKLGIVLILANVVLAIALTFGNKMLLGGHHKFNFPAALTGIQYFVAWLCISGAGSVGLVELLPWKLLALDRNLFALFLLTAMVQPLNNLNLHYNTVGTYQLLKLLVTPTICFIEYILNAKTTSYRRMFLLMVSSVGVGMFTVHGIGFNWIGGITGIILMPVSGGYKVQWVRVQKQLQSKLGVSPASCALSLTHRVYPLAIPLVFIFSFLTDPAGILEFEYTYGFVFRLILSGIGAGALGLSTVSVVVGFSPLSHQVLGMGKICMSVLLGTILLGESSPNRIQLAGLVISLFAIILYTKVTTDENAARRAIIKAESKTKEVRQLGGAYLV